MEALVAKAGTRRGEFAHPLEQPAAVAGLQVVVPRRSSQAAEPAGEADTQLKAPSDPSGDISAPSRG
jgi:hypothetical protein